MKQLTVLVPNQPGQLAKISEALAARGVNIEDFDVESNGADGKIGRASCRERVSECV